MGGWTDLMVDQATPIFDPSADGQAASRYGGHIPVFTVRIPRHQPTLWALLTVVRKSAKAAKLQVSTTRSSRTQGREPCQVSNFRSSAMPDVVGRASRRNAAGRAGLVAVAVTAAGGEA